jgi:predicted DNA-binding protein
MDTRKRGSTSEMQVTSIRLEPKLKERLREISGEQGYQTLIREVLWQFVDQQMVSDEVRWRSLSERESYAAEDRRSPSHPPLLSMSDIRATFRAVSQQEEQCAITGQRIQPQQEMLLGLTTNGEMIALSMAIA